MSVIDIVISIVVFIGLWRGFQSGMIKTMSSLVAWFLALIIASKMADDVSPFFMSVVTDPVLQTALAFVVVMLLVVMVVQLIAGVMTKTINVLKLGFLDKLAGGVLGALTGVLKVLVVLSVAAPLLVKTPAWQSSALAQSLLPYAPVAKSLLQKAFGEAWNQVENPYKNTKL